MLATIYRYRSGEIKCRVDMPEEAIRLQTPRGSGLSWVPGHYDAATHVIVKKMPVERSRAPAVTRAQVNTEAARRIETIFPMWRQINILRTGSAAEVEAMSRYIDAVRAASNDIDPVSTDYQDSRHWPIEPAGTSLAVPFGTSLTI
jgi:hypothetical protein